MTSAVAEEIPFGLYECGQWDSSQGPEKKYRFRALTREVSPTIGSCELTYRTREPIHFERARQQLHAYWDLLRRWTIDFVIVPADPCYPDCCFIQDTAVVLDEVCILPTMGSPSRRGEITEIQQVFSGYRPIQQIVWPATLDGGDVVQIGQCLFVGLSSRTNSQGVEALRRIVAEFGYEVVPVTVNGGLHLTTGCGVINDETVLLNPRWLDASAFNNFRQLHVPETEPWAANTIRCEELVCLEANAPRTMNLVEPFARRVETLDISEFRKAEGSLSCLSLIFKEQLTS